MSAERKLVLASQVEPEPKLWLWDGRIPLGGITLLEGDSGEGKTAITHDLIGRVTTGTPMPITGDVVGPAGVVLLQAEDLLAATTRPALEAAGADLARIMVFDKRQFAEEPLLLPDDVGIIEAAIDKVRAKLVVLDPLPAFLAGSTNSEHSARKAMGRLAAMAESKGVAVVVVRHLTKSRFSNPKYRGGGSISIIGAARSALIVVDAPQGDDPFEHVLAVNKNNMGTAAPLRYRTVMDHGVIKVEWLGECLSSASDLLEGCGDRFESSQLDEACYVLYSVLAGVREGKPAKEVLKEATNALVSVRTLKRAKRRLGVKSYRRRRDDKDGEVADDGGEASWEWVWKLPDDEAVLRPYRDRAVRERAEEQAEEVAEEPTVPPEQIGATSTDEDPSEAPKCEIPFDIAGRSWEETDDTQALAETVSAGREPSRSWDD